MFFDFIRLEHIIKSEMVIFFAYALLVYILFYCISFKANSKNIFSLGSYTLLWSIFTTIVVILTNTQLFSSCFFDVDSSGAVLTAQDLVLGDRRDCRILTNYFVLHSHPNMGFVHGDLIPFLANKQDFAFLPFIQKYMVAHLSESDDTLFNFILICDREFKSRIFGFFYNQHYLPSTHVLIWEDLRWYFYIHGAVPQREFFSFLIDYLTVYGPKLQDLIDKYLTTCPVPSQRYISWLKDLNPFHTLLLNDPEFIKLDELVRGLPRLREFDAYLKPLIGDKFVPVNELYTYLKIHKKEEWSEKFVRTLIDYMSSEVLQSDQLKAVYFECHANPNHEYIKVVAETNFFYYIARNMPEFPIFIRQWNEIMLRKELDAYLQPFIGDKIVNKTALYYYVLAHYEDRNAEFVKALITYMTNVDEVQVETIVKQYMDLHKTPDMDFVKYLKKANFYEVTLANDPSYPIHRSNLASLQANISNYNNWVSTDLVENPDFFLKLVFFSYVLFMLALCGLVLSRVNLVIFLLFTELMIFCSVFLLIVASQYLELPFGQVYALLLLGVAAAEAAVGLGLLLVVYRIRGHLTFK